MHSRAKGCGLECQCKEVLNHNKKTNSNELQEFNAESPS